jgi:hypothetical protein
VSAEAEAVARDKRQGLEWIKCGCDFDESQTKEGFSCKSKTRDRVSPSTYSKH